MPAKVDPRLPYRELDDSFLPPRDPVLGYVKVGGKDPDLRYTRAGKPWARPMRLLDPARFEITTREKIGKRVEGRGSSKGQSFTVDLGYVRDQPFHDLESVGDTPSSLRIRFLYPRWNQNLISFLGAFGREWVCRGNGVKATDIKRGACACPCPRLEQFSGEYDQEKRPKDELQCKPHAQLNMLLEDADVFGGFWAFKTTSFATISNLIKSLRIFEEMFDRIDGLPLELRVMAVTMQLPGGGTTVQPIVTIVLPAAMQTARQVAGKAAEEARKFLPAGRELDHETYIEAVVVEMEEEAKSYASEYLPDNEEAGGGPSDPGPRDPSKEEAEDPDATPSPARQQGEPPVDAEPKSGDPDEPTGTGTEEGGEPSRVVDEVDGPTREEETDPDADGFDEPASAHRAEAADDSDRNKSEEAVKIARAVLEAIGWEEKAIQGRIDHHLEQRSLDALLERLERTAPKAWAKATQPDLEGLEGSEPDDGLPA